MTSAAHSLAAMRAEARDCRACPLWRDATQTVFGEGPADAKLVFVGEQPGDREDRAGQPFVGPAGMLFDRALAAAGIERADVYVTNAVKHFKHEPRGKRRLHKRPNAGEIDICRRWLLGELDALAPPLVVALGATAARSLAHRPIAVNANRGATLDLPEGRRVFITIHPSSLLRTRDEEARRAGFDAFVNDLRAAARLCGSARLAHEA